MKKRRRNGRRGKGECSPLKGLLYSRYFGGARMRERKKEGRGSLKEKRSGREGNGEMGEGGELLMGFQFV